MARVAQEFVLGPLLFDNCLNDLFYFPESNNVCNFPDYSRQFYACDKDLNSLINRLEDDSYLAIDWFENNSIKLNQGKCNLLKRSKKQKLLGVEIDKTFSFDEYICFL